MSGTNLQCKVGLDAISSVQAVKTVDTKRTGLTSKSKGSRER